MSEYLMTESLDGLSNYDIEIRVVTLTSEKDHLREEMLEAEANIEENANNRIIATFLRQMIVKVNTRLSELIRERNRREVSQRQNQN